MSAQEEPQEASLDEIQAGIFSLVVSMYVANTQKMSEHDAKLMTAAYLKSLIDGLLKDVSDESKQEESNK